MKKSKSGIGPDCEKTPEQQVATRPVLPPVPVASECPDPDERELHRGMAAAVKFLSKPAVVAVARNKEGAVKAPHSSDVLWHASMMEAFGTASTAFSTTLLGQLEQATRPRATAPQNDSGANLNAAIAMIDGLKPQTEVEAMLAAQMAGTHALAMEMLGKTRQCSELRHLNEYGNMANKLMRTFTAQMEALARFRRGGEQKVTVEHVHVHAGGQAIVGAVNHTGGGGGGYENPRQAQTSDARSVAFALGSPVWSSDPEGNALRGGCSEREIEVPDARRRQRIRRTERQT